jgi:tRNA nucleotidyltransferase (CCA-adding enzyme)
METLSTQFEQALKNIEISGRKRERAINAHEEMRGVLELSEDLQKLGIETVLIGSHARRTGIYPGRDVDVFAKLTKLDESAEPRRVFDAVREVLVDHHGARAEPQRRSSCSCSSPQYRAACPSASAYLP